MARKFTSSPDGALGHAIAPRQAWLPRLLAALDRRSVGAARLPEPEPADAGEKPVWDVPKHWRRA